MKRVILIVFSVIFFLIAIPLLIAGAVFTAIGAGDDPTVDGRIGHVDSSGYAAVSDTLDVDWNVPYADRFDIRLGARSARPETPVFIGYGPATSVDAYLSGVPHTLVYSIGDATRSDREVEIPGSSAPQPPGDQDFWLEQASGTGLQQVPLASQTGSYRLVVMNADASRQVDAVVSGSMTLPFLLPVGIGMLLVGLLLFAVAVAFLIWGLRSRPAPAQAPMAYPHGQPQSPMGPPGYPGGGSQYGPPTGYPGGPMGYPGGPPVGPQPPVHGAAPPPYGGTPGPDQAAERPPTIPPGESAQDGTRGG